MASAANNTGTSSKPFHTYENVGFDAERLVAAEDVVGYSSSSAVGGANNNGACPASLATNASLTSNGFAQIKAPTLCPAPSLANTVGAGTAAAIAVTKTAIESPFQDPLLGGTGSASDTITNPSSTAKILSATDSTGTTTTTRISGSSAAGTSIVAATTSSSAGAAATVASGSCSSAARLHHTPGGLVTRLITFPPQSPMDSLREWSLSTLKCTKQLINERRGLCPVTSDSQLASEIEQLRETRARLVQMLRLGQQMVAHYGQLVRTQRQLHSLVNEMSIKCFTVASGHYLSPHLLGHVPNPRTKQASKQVVANFSSLSNNLSSSTTTTTTSTGGQSPTRSLHHRGNHNGPPPSSSSSAAAALDHFEDFLPVLNHMKTFNDTNLADDFKRNALTLNVAIRNGEKLIAALNFYCSNLSTLINKTIEDTLDTVKQFELARLEYDAEKNSLNLLAASSQTSATYSSDKVELARLRYEQLREDVLIKLRFLEENTVKVMHKQLLLFNGAFASYTAGNTAALDSTLKQFSIKD